LEEPRKGASISIGAWKKGERNNLEERGSEEFVSHPRKREENGGT